MYLLMLAAYYVTTPLKTSSCTGFDISWSADRLKPLTPDFWDLFGMTNLLDESSSREIASSLSCLLIQCWCITYFGVITFSVISADFMDCSFVQWSYLYVTLMLSSGPNVLNLLLIRVHHYVQSRLTCLWSKVQIIYVKA